MDWTALWLTLQLASGTTAILLVGGLPLAYWLARSRRRGKFLVESLISLPLVLPPTVMGFYLLWGMGPESTAGRAFEAVTGGRLPFSFAGILLGSVIYNLPFAVRPFSAALEGVDQRLIEAAWCLGVSRWETFRHVVLPLAWRGLLAGMVLTFAHTVGEFGIVLMVGGSIPGVTRTLSVAIYDDVQALNYEAAGQTSIVLLGFSFAALCGLHLLQRRPWPV